jgi:arsenical-resistance protein 2
MDKEMESLVLSEGIKGWATAKAEFVDHMEGYDASFWAGK